MLHVLDRTYAWPLWLGLLAAAAGVAVAAYARVRGAPLPPRVALLLAALPVGAALFAVHAGHRGVGPQPADYKLHIATIALAEALDATRLAAVTTLVAAAVVAAVSRDLRRDALAAVPAAAGLVAWGAWQGARLAAVAVLPSDVKVAAWFAGEPTSVLLAAALVAVGGLAAAAARSRVAIATAIAPALPAVVYPAYVFGRLLAER